MMLKVFFSANGQVDPTVGVITGVSVITSGVEAAGHNIYIDDTTLSQVKACADSFGASGVQVKMDHGTGFAAIVGVLKNFRIDAETGGASRLRADLHLLKTHTAFATILEMAANIPDSFGLSISFSGGRQTIDKLDYARCAELYSVDLVSSPAANPNGLFARIDSAPFTESMITELTALWKTLGEKLSALTAKPENAGELELVKTSLSDLGTKISVELSQAQSDLQTAKASIQSLNTELATAKTALETNLSAVNTALNAAAGELKIELKADASVSDKITALQNGVSTTLARAGFPAAKIPAVPAVTNEKSTMTRAEFALLSPAAKMSFMKASGKLTD